MEESKKPESSRPNKKKKIIYYGLMSFFAIVFIGSALYIGNYFWGSHQESRKYDDLANLRDQLLNQQTTAPATEPDNTTMPDNTTEPEGTTVPPVSEDPTGPTDVPTEPTETTGPTEPTEPSMLPELVPFYEMNDDLIGWICFPGTKIDYPVLQTPDDPNFYLYRNFYKEDSRWGAIYANEDCDVFAPSDNVTLYGHNMKDKSMFGILDKYQFQNYWEEHQTFTFDTLYERRTYRIFAVFKTTALADKGFMYHSFVDASNEAAFNRFIDRIKRLDYYDTGITPVYGDKIVCLSTCEYTQTHGRFVVCAVLEED